MITDELKLMIGSHTFDAKLSNVADTEFVHQSGNFICLELPGNQLETVKEEPTQMDTAENDATEKVESEASTSGKSSPVEMVSCEISLHYSQN